MSYAYRIEGGYPVIGEISCLGAKNFVIKAMVAALLGKTPTTLTNVPPIGDVDITAEMLTSIGLYPSSAAARLAHARLISTSTPSKKLAESSRKQQRDTLPIVFVP